MCVNIINSTFYRNVTENYQQKRALKLVLFVLLSYRKIFALVCTCSYDYSANPTKILNIVMWAWVRAIWMKMEKLEYNF